MFLTSQTSNTKSSCLQDLFYKVESLNCKFIENEDHFSCLENFNITKAFLFSFICSPFIFLFKVFIFLLEWNFLSCIGLWASLLAQMVKNLLAMQETQFNPWVGKIFWRREWLPISVFLPGEVHGQSILVGYRHDWATNMVLLTNKATLCFALILF